VTEPGTVLVTGASGLAGSHLLAHLARSQDIVGWTRSSPPAACAGQTRWHRIDLLDRDAVRAAILDLRPAAVYHCAGVSRVDRSWHAPAETLAGNVLATHHLLDALRRAGTRCRVVVTGSAAIYAPSPDPLTEGARVAPDSPYALSKLAQERLGVRAVAEDGIEVVLTRSFNHTGPGQSPSFMASGIARQIALIERGALEPVLRVGNVEARRDLTDVRDVVRAYTVLMEAGTPGEVYNVASGVGRTVGAVIDTLVALAGVQVRVEVDPDRLRPLDNPVLVGDASKLRGLTGWAPSIRFDRMLGDLLEYWRGER
jgi:GDP-4-dehydro-6-deoxy-D-mannose reductase